MVAEGGSPSLGFFEAFLGSSRALSPRRLLEYSSYKLPELILYGLREGCGLTVFTRELLTPFINEVPVEVGVLGFGFVLFLVHRPLFLPNLLLPLLIDKGLEEFPNEWYAGKQIFQVFVILSSWFLFSSHDRGRVSLVPA